jgi:hypothetical protein
MKSLLKTLLLSGFALASVNALANEMVSVSTQTFEAPSVPQPTPPPSTGRFVDGGVGKPCATPTYTCARTNRQISCKIEPKEATDTTYCVALYGDVGVVNCFLTDSKNQVTAHIVDACP